MGAIEAPWMEHDMECTLKAQKAGGKRKRDLKQSCNFSVDVLFFNMQ